MAINDIAPFIDYENVNRNAPYDPTMIDRMSEAKGMLQQNVPIEMIIQQTGVPRETLQQLLVSMQNIGRPTAPGTPPPVMSNQENKPTQQQMVDEFGLVGSNNTPEQIDARFKEIKMNPTDPLSNREQGMLDSYTGSGGIPSLPVQPKVANVMPENARLMPDAPNFMPDVDMPDNPGGEIADYLTDELGFDPATGESQDNLSVNQEFNQANAEVALGSEDPEGEMDKLLRAQSILKGQPDNDVVATYKDALLNYAGLDYKDFIKTPDEGMPFLVAGLSLIESGSKGETWGDALSKAVGKGLVTKKKGDMQYQDQINNFELKTAMSKDASIRTFIGDAIKSEQKIAENMRIGTRKNYVVAVPNQDNKIVMPLTSGQVDLYTREFGPGSVTEYDSSKNASKNYVITNNNGDSYKKLLLESDLQGYKDLVDQGKIQSILVGTAESDTNDLSVMTRPKGKGKDYPYTYTMTTAEGYNKMLNDPNLDSKVFDPKGYVEVIDLKGDGSLERIPQVQYMANRGQYRLKSGFMASISNGDTSIELMSDGIPGGTSLMSDKQIGLSVEKNQVVPFRSRKYLTDEISRNITDIVTNIGGMENPDLAFDNLAGRSLEFGRSLITNVNAFGNIMRSGQGTVGGKPIKKFNYKVDGENVSYQAYQDYFMQTEAFKEFEAGSFGQYILAASPSRAVGKAALFNLALKGATAMGGSADLDMRAISDKDMELFMTMVGSNASNFTDFKAVINEFHRNIIQNEMNFLETQLEIPPKKLEKVRIPGTDQFEDKLVDIFEMRGLYEYRDKRIPELQKMLDAIDTPRVDLNTGTQRNPTDLLRTMNLEDVSLPNGEVITSTALSGHEISGKNLSYAELVAYIASVPPSEQSSKLASIRSNLQNSGQAQNYSIFLNMLQNSGVINGN